MASSPVSKSCLSIILMIEFLFLKFPKLSCSSPDTIFILAGQSNMAGRGGVNCSLFCTKNCTWDEYIPPESMPQPSILRFTSNYTWEQGREPLHWDIDSGKTNGVGPGMAFANHLLAKASQNVGVIGLVPCAIGGSHLIEWIKGTRRYTSLIGRINASLESGGHLQGFVWFQGESDAALKVESQVYHQNLIKFFKDLRDDLNQPTLPILLVKIANHDLNISPFINYIDDVRRAEAAVDHELLDVTTVDAKKAVQLVLNLGQKPYNRDGHLSVHTEVKIGIMLAKVYLKLSLKK